MNAVTKPQILKEIKDKYYLTFITFSLMGITGGAQQNFILTANSYWDYKFRDISNVTANSNEKSNLQLKFTSYFQLVSMGPLILIIICSVLLSRIFSFKSRVLFSITFVTIAFLSNVVFVNINTDSWQELFFYVSLGINFLISAFGISCLGAFFYVQGKFPKKYMTALGSGQSTGCIFAALLQILSISMVTSETATGNIYFGIGSLVILLSFVLCILTLRSEFFNYFLEHTYFKSDEKMEKVLLFQVLKKLYLIGFGCALNMFIAMGFGSGFLVLIKSQDDGVWGKKYFVPVIVYLLYYIFEFMGKCLSGYVRKPMSPNYFLVATVLRFLIVFLLFGCNLHAKDKSWPTIFDQDYQAAILIAIHGILFGYLINQSNFIVVKSLKPNEMEVGFGIMLIFVASAGTLSSFLNTWLIENLITK